MGNALWHDGYFGTANVVRGSEACTKQEISSSGVLGPAIGCVGYRWQHHT